ncbi:hypothetical protein DVH24_013756 [Malus domestica]|uniref:Uncharacterized protein n=1 Tax=Malus domestica TaxID=3750 RepID=A0A498JCF0_MALDO|nr:hypothetical protein DVH24_013756 [Malus domestica]
MANHNFSSSSLLRILILLLDIETRQKKSQCYADIQSGLWGWQCKSSLIAKENCALRCLSPTCYELIYESDPLEEGEKDMLRGQEFKYCMHNLPT